MHGDRADLAEVLPQNVQRAAPDDLAGLLGDKELLYVLVEGDGLLREQHLARVHVDELPDRPHVRGARGPHDDHVRDVRHGSPG